jgi:hypothetical protein
VAEVYDTYQALPLSEIAASTLLLTPSNFASSSAGFQSSTRLLWKPAVP